MITTRISPRRRAAVIAGFSVVAAIATLSGCSANAAGAKDETITIGAALNSEGNPFFLAEGDGISAEAKKLGAKTSIQYANADVATQSDQIDTLIRNKVDVIIVDAVDSEGIGPAVLRAHQAHIPVVAIDVSATGADATVTSDNVTAGFDACEYLIKQIGANGKLAIVDGSPVSAVTDRVNGCKDAVKKTGSATIVANQRADLTRDKSLEIATNILTAHPDVQAIFGVNDTTAVGIELAAKQKGADIKIAGVDGAKQATDSIGKGLIVATSAQDPKKLGSTGVDLALKLAKGEKVSSKPQLVPTTLVTTDNINSYTPWG